MTHGLDGLCSGEEMAGDLIDQSVNLKRKLAAYNENNTIHDSLKRRGKQDIIKIQDIRAYKLEYYHN